MIINFIRTYIFRHRDADLLDARAMKDKRRWTNRRAHIEFANDVGEFLTYWFQLICFLYIAFHVITMAWAGETEKSTNWALIALIIKPWGKEIRA